MAPTPDLSGVNWPLETFRVLATSAISIGVTGIFLQKWKDREKFVEDHISALIAEVEAATMAAVAYWELSPKGYRKRLTEDGSPESPHRESSLEAEILALQTRIARARSLVGDFLDKNEMQALFNEEGELFSALTGGSFKSRERVCEIDRFQQIRDRSANYVTAVKRARRKRLEQSIWKSLFER